MTMKLSSKWNPVDSASSDRTERIRRVIDARTNRQIRELQIELEGATLVISGRAETYYSKQLAPHAALDVADAMIIQIDVVVGA